MARKTELYSSKASIPNLRRSAPQINPNVARMYPTTGMEKGGSALFDVGEKMHQVNVTRQVTAALAEYKMKEAEFMAKMQNADPSKTNFTEEFNKFQAQQGGLALGVSRDASNLISNKLKTYGAASFGQLKQIEIRNTRGMVLAEAPEILENLVNECAKDPSKCGEKKAEWDSYLQGIAPALRPYESAKLKTLWDDAEQEATEQYQEDQVYAQINAGNIEGAEQLTGASNLPEKKKRTLYNAAKAQKAKVEKISTLERDRLRNEHSGLILDSLGTGNMHAVPENLPVLGEMQDRINISRGQGTSNMQDVDLPAIYYSLKDKADNMVEISDYELVEAQYMGTPDSEILALRALNKENEEFRGIKREISPVIANANKNYEKLKKTIYDYDFDNDTAEILVREIEEERQAHVATMKKEVKNGKTLALVRKEADDVFESTRDGILEGPIKRFFKPMSREWEEGMQKPGRGSAELDERQRVRGIINLLRSGGKYTREIQAAVDANWFTERAIEAEKVSRAPVGAKTPVGGSYVPFAADGRYYAAPLAEGQTEADAMLSGFDTGNMKEFDTIEEVEKFTGKKMR